MPLFKRNREPEPDFWFIPAPSAFMTSQDQSGLLSIASVRDPRLAVRYGFALILDQGPSARVGNGILQTGIDNYMLRALNALTAQMPLADYWRMLQHLAGLLNDHPGPEPGVDPRLLPQIHGPRMDAWNAYFEGRRLPAELAYDHQDVLLSVTTPQDLARMIERALAWAPEFFLSIHNKVSLQWAEQQLAPGAPDGPS